MRLAGTGIPLALLAAAAGCREPATPAAGAAANDAGAEETGVEATQIEQREVTVAGGRVRVLEAGPAGAPVVLLLHGGRFSSETWRELGTLGVLAEADLRVVAPDLPGFGASERGTGERGAFLAAFLDALAIERATVVAPSMSGSFAFPFVLAHPERVAAFVPVAPAAIPPSAETLASIEVPTLVVWGSADTTFPPSDGRALARAIEGAELLVLEGASHPCYLDDPETFHARLKDFVPR